MDLGLADRTIVITGASSGIGLACAELLADQGCRLVLQGRTQLDVLRRWVRRRGLSRRALIHAADVTQHAELEALVAAAAKRFGALHGCVVSAGIWPPQERLLCEETPERIAEVVAVDLLGAIWTARAFQRQARRHSATGTSLVLIGSTAGRFGEAGHTAYAVAKAGLHGLMLSYKNEIVRIDPTGRVNLVEPGWTLTPMTADELEDDAQVTAVVRTMALRRIARAEEIAAACAYFLSPTVAAHVTGQTLTLAGGMEGRVLWSRREIDPARIRRALRSRRFKTRAPRPRPRRSR